MSRMDGSYWDHIPPSPLNGGIPLSTDIQAPVNATRCFELAIRPAALTISFSLLNMILNYGLPNNSAIFCPISAGDTATDIPHSNMIFILASAVSAFPPIIAPA